MRYCGFTIGWGLSMSSLKLTALCATILGLLTFLGTVR